MVISPICFHLAGTKDQKTIEKSLSDNGKALIHVRVATFSVQERYENSSGL